jgi:hypothetical protein
VRKIEIGRRSVTTTIVAVAFAATAGTLAGTAQAGTLLSQGKPATASSTEGAGFEAARAVDGSSSTRWASVEPATTNQWIYVDLGTTATIDRVVLNWEAAYAKSYQVQVSSNASTWTSLFSTTSGDGGVDDLAVSGSGRYVRILCTKRGTSYGYSLWELQVYGTAGGGSCSTLPSVPTGLSSPGKTSSSVDLAWNASTPGANCTVQYRVFQGGTQVTQVSGTSATVSGLSASTTYSFTVGAINQFGSSAQSSPLSVTTSSSTPAPTEVFFDDFLYTGSSDANLTSFGWSARSGDGGPGDGTWSPSYLTFVNGPVNKVLRLTATVSGSSVVQSELDFENEKMLEGTYAARVWFGDAPDSGSDGDYIVEANFWTMSDWAATTGKTSYSELDFEYLPNGGWDMSGPRMWNTSWEQDDPASNQETTTPRSFAGWHTLLIVVSGGQVKYYDGATLLASHGGIYYPESKMSIIPQLWFTQINTASSSWHVDDDWVFYARNTVLTAQQVEDLVAGYRAAGVARRNTLP